MLILSCSDEVREKVLFKIARVFVCVCVWGRERVFLVYKERFQLGKLHKLFFTTISVPSQMALKYYFSKVIKSEVVLLKSEEKVSVALS